jgi:phage shock protein E
MKKLLVTMCWSVGLAGLMVAAELKVEDVSPKKVTEILATKNAPKVIDVRTADEFSEGHIKGATVIDVTSEDFEKKLAKLDPEKSYIVHCRSGGRSAKALKVFKKLGFKHVYHMNEGFMAWKKAGQPVEKE